MAARKRRTTVAAERVVELLKEIEAGEKRAADHAFVRGFCLAVVELCTRQTSPRHLMAMLNIKSESELRAAGVCEDDIAVLSPVLKELRQKKRRAVVWLPRKAKR